MRIASKDMGGSGCVYACSEGISFSRHSAAPSRGALFAETETASWKLVQGNVISIERRHILDCWDSEVRSNLLRVPEHHC